MVLLDLTLPDANRLATIEKVRAAAGVIPIVVLTVHDDDGLALQSLREGAQDYVTKSDLQASTLRRSMRYAIERQNAEVARGRTQGRYLLAAELASARQLERKRLANELHDYLAQILAAAQLKLGAVPETSVTGDARSNLDDVKGLLRDAVDYTRTLVADLHPTILRASGLAPALEHLASTMANHGLEVQTVLADDDFELDGERAELVYQSVRELLFNVVKHADVTEATLDSVFRRWRRGDCGHRHRQRVPTGIGTCEWTLRPTERARPRGSAARMLQSGNCARLRHARRAACADRDGHRCPRERSDLSPA